MQGYGHTLRETCEIAIFSFIQAERFLAQHTREIYNKNGLTLGHIQ
jgi:hypothetical protein